METHFIFKLQPSRVLKCDIITVFPLKTKERLKGLSVIAN